MDYHLHTNHSMDGRQTMPELCETMLARGVQENDIARAMIHRQDTELIKNDRTGEIGECVCKAEHLWYFDDLSVPRQSSAAASRLGTIRCAGRRRRRCWTRCRWISACCRCTW